MELDHEDPVHACDGWRAFNSITVTDSFTRNIVFSAAFPFAVSACLRSLTTKAIVPYSGIVLKIPSKCNGKVSICLVTVEAKIVVKLFNCYCC